MKREYTLREVIRSSQYLYKSKKVDNKSRRSRIDIINGKLIIRKNIVYNKSSKSWEQKGHQVKFVFLVKSDPISYKKTDTIKIHKYPVTFIIDNFNLGIDSKFRWRTGSNAKPKLKSTLKKKKENLADYNISKGIQMQFFFDLEWILSKNKLLFGPNRAAWSPKKTNPKGYIYFDKTAWFIVTKILSPILIRKKGAIINLIAKNL